MSENTDRNERMTGTPSKDRAELAREMAHVLSAPMSHAEMRDYIAGHLNGCFAEGMKRAAEIARSEGVGPETNAYAFGPSWYRHGQRIAAAILSEAGER